jgi:hypothetical protein
MLAVVRSELDVESAVVFALHKRQVPQGRAERGDSAGLRARLTP